MQQFQCNNYSVIPHYTVPGTDFKLSPGATTRAGLHSLATRTQLSREGESEPGVAVMTGDQVKKGGGGRGGGRTLQSRGRI